MSQKWVSHACWQPGRIGGHFRRGRAVVVAGSLGGYLLMILRGTALSDFYPAILENFTLVPYEGLAGSGVHLGNEFTEPRSLLFLE